MSTAVSTDPVVTDPELYSVVFENERVRVLEYRDGPGDRTCEHSHPDMVIIPLATFRRRLSVGGRTFEVEKTAHEAGWVDAHTHSGENIGDGPSHALFVELKEARPTSR
ncbi:cytoplasmic protein [Pseudonocardia broussonetiae]|uniref:Cytoplasmic protein n=1 Tax=Pseudonocardia broussonetiae TaxID=2736640 RepID=A0A6M6JDZ5_9PSEU|nr:cytoplasmic protein [Pseudonocardia broussonetiae]QJY46148.1 cytoplasmic protein [Pseudonocardia broussonetiae]